MLGCQCCQLASFVAKNQKKKKNPQMWQFFLRKGSKTALQAAKSNIERHFAVVGLMDDFEGLLQVLEAVLPDFFEGVTQE